MTINSMAFYPNIKAYISPSALATWCKGKSAFVKSYFLGEKTPETLAMKAGTRIHKLIEIGAIQPIKKFDVSEQGLSAIVTGCPAELMGRPDDRTDGKKPIEFVDYKTGQKETWDEHTLKSDIKMLATAYLVWLANGNPATDIIGHIEWIETIYDKEQRDIVPTGRPHEVYSVSYTPTDMQKFEVFLAKTMGDINEEYAKFLESTDLEIDPDLLAEYQSLETQKLIIEVRQDEIKKTVGEQMKSAGKRSLPTTIGTFSITENKSYEYPTTLKVNYGTYGLVLEDIEEINKALKAVKKIWERENEPVEITNKVSFRAKK